MKEPQFEKMNGISISTEARKKYAVFEAQYNHLREQEGRSFSRDEIRQLPDTASDHPHHNEWEKRKSTAERFLRYLLQKQKTLHILDVGCGNGFFAARLARAGHHVSGVDISLFELEQAAEAFGGNNPKWFYADITSERLPTAPFDVICLNASIQYFEFPETLLKVLLGQLRTGGEIHLLDSPIYDNDKVAQESRDRSLEHFRGLGSAAMIQHYHAHTGKFLKEFSHEKLADPGLISRILRKNESPFPWIRIKKA